MVSRLSGVLAVIACASSHDRCIGRNPYHPSHQPPTAAKSKASGRPMSDTLRERLPLLERVREGHAGGEIVILAADGSSPDDHAPLLAPGANQCFGERNRAAEPVSRGSGMTRVSGPTGAPLESRTCTAPPSACPTSSVISAAARERVLQFLELFGEHIVRGRRSRLQALVELFQGAAASAARARPWRRRRSWHDQQRIPTP